MGKVIGWLLLAVTAWAQLETTELRLRGSVAPGPSGATIRYIGEPGPHRSDYYWIIAEHEAGMSAPLGPMVAYGVPATLDETHYVVLDWEAVTGALNYRIIRARTPVWPGSGNYQIGQVSGSTTTFADTGLVASAYTYAPATAVTARLAVNPLRNTLQVNIPIEAEIAGTQIYYDVRRYGAVGDGETDDTAAIQATINAASGGGVVWFPPGVYRITNTLTVAGYVTLLGAGQEASLILNSSTTATAVRFDLGGVSGRLTRAAGLRDITIAAGSVNSNNAQASTGNGLHVISANDAFEAERFTVRNHAVGVRLENCWYPRLSRFTVWHYADAGVMITGDADHGSEILSQFLISDLGSTNVSPTAAGILITSTGGSYIESGDVTSSRIGLWVLPDANRHVTYLFVDQVKFDTCSEHGVILDPSNTNSRIVSVHFTNSWSSYNGWTGSAWQQRHGLWIKPLGTGATVDGVYWHGGRLRENGGSGLYADAGKNIVVSNAEVAANGKAGESAGNGLEFHGMCENVTVSGNRIGNFASSSPLQQAYALVFNAYGGTCDKVVITGNDLRDNVAGPIYWNNVTQAVVRNNAGLDDVMETIPSAATITLGAGLTYKISGSTPVSTINGGWLGRTVDLIFTDVAPGGLVTGGNVGADCPASQNTVIRISYDGSLWYCATPGTLSGTGTAGALARWVGSTQLGDSALVESSSVIESSKEIRAPAFSTSNTPPDTHRFRTTSGGSITLSPADSTSDYTLTMPAADGTISLQGHQHSASDVTSGVLGLARGGTNNDTWTAGRCVQVSSDGSKLESASAACGSGGTSIGLWATNYGAATVSANTTTYGNFSLGTWNTSYNNRTQYVMGSVVFSNLCVETGTAQPSDGALTISFWTWSGGTTSLSVTIPPDGASGQYCDTTNTVAVSSGERVAVKLVNASTSASASVRAIGVRYVPQ